LPFEADYDQQTNFLRRATQLHRDINTGKNEPNPTYTCSNRDPYGTDTTSFAFLPVLAAEVSPSSPKASYTSSKCFESITFDFV